ncbi:MAG: hypothetical protein ACOYJA_07595 [Christensenellales bacterium]|jgi:hypothetical protein
MKHKKLVPVVLIGCLCLLMACQPIPEASRYNHRLAAVSSQQSGVDGENPAEDGDKDSWDGFNPYIQKNELFQTKLSANGQEMEIRAHVRAPEVDTAQEMIVSLMTCDQQEQDKLASVWIGNDAYQVSQNEENQHEWFRQLWGVQDDRRYIEFDSSITFHAGYADQEKGKFAAIHENQLTEREFETRTGTSIQDVQNMCFEMLTQMGLAQDYTQEPTLSCYGKIFQPTYCEVVFQRAFPQLPAWGRGASYFHTPTTLKESPMKHLSGECIQIRCTGQQILDISCTQSSILEQHEISLLPFSTIIAALEDQFYMDPPVTVSGERICIEQIDLCYVGEPLVDDSVGPNDLIVKHRMRPMWVFTGVNISDPDAKKEYFIDAETGEMILTGK